MKLRSFIFVIFSLSTIGFTKGQSTDDNYKGLKEEKINSTQLADWQIWGQGEVFNVGEQTCLKEHDETKGVMLVSPKAYNERVILKFKVLALTPASVVAVVLSGSNPGESSALSIPEAYDGNFGLWAEEKENYFFAFKNAPHGLTPFIRKNPVPGEILAAAEDNMMVAGLYYDIELGRIGNKLWLSINNEKAFEIEDEEALSGGHVAFRIRGTAGFKGACLIRDLTIYSE